MKGCHRVGEKKSRGRREHGRKRMTTKSMQSLVLTSPPPAAHPSCIHLDGYRRSWCQTTGCEHTPTTRTHTWSNRERTATHTCKRHTEEGSIYWRGGETPSLFLSLLLPPPPLPPSLSFLFAILAQCAHPSGSGCSDDVLPAATTARSLFGRRAADWHALWLYPSVRLSIPPSFAAFASPLSAATHVANCVPSFSIISVSLSLSPCFSFPPVGSGGAVTIKKKKNTEINKPLPLPPSSSPSPSLSPAPRYYSHNTHTFPYVPGKQTGVGGDGKLISDMVRATPLDSAVCLCKAILVFL